MIILSESCEKSYEKSQKTCVLNYSECMKCPLTPSLHFSQPILGPKNTRLLIEGAENEVTGEDNTIAFGLESIGVDGRVAGCCSSLSFLLNGTVNMGVGDTTSKTGCIFPE